MQGILDIMNPFYTFISSSDGDGYRYWRAERGSSQINSGSFWFNRPIAVRIEATSYALMTSMIMENRTTILTDGLSTVKWLNEDRNALGGHSQSRVSVAWSCIADGKVNFILKWSEILV